MRKHHAQRQRLVYVGLLDARPHVQCECGARIISVYVSKAAAKRAYADVRKARLLFDAEGTR